MDRRQQLVEKIECIRRAVEQAGRDISVMEVCGTHTVALFRAGVRSLLPQELKLVSGPGCPVCVTPQGYIDAAAELSLRPDTTVCTYGDMVRVPGARGSLADMRGRGGTVQVVYSARDALQLAARYPDRTVVFLAVGFETTAPATAATLMEARTRQVRNFLVLSGHKRVVPAMRALLSAGEVPIDGFLCPGHVSVVLGAAAYEPIAREFYRPCVVAGFEPGDMLEAVARTCEQVAAGRAEVDNAYPAVVSDGGNRQAMTLIKQVFQPARSTWRAMGTIDESGLEMNEQYRPFDAAQWFGLDTSADEHPPGCLCGEVIQGKVAPDACELFGTGCTPTRPIGPCMVSSEGTCAAWYKYDASARRRRSGR